VSIIKEQTMRTTNQVIWILEFLGAFAANDCRAQFNGSDDFNDNSKDPARWGPDFTTGSVGLLTETNGRLEFTTSGVPASSTLVARPWVLNFGSYNQNWEVHIDANLPHPGFAESVFGLIVASGTNVTSNNRFQMSLFESSTEGQLFLMRFGANGGSFDRAGQIATTSTFAGLRIAFDPSTKVLSAFYDEDGPVNGYSWTLLGSTNISTAWSMTSTSVFGVSVFGRVEGGSVASTDNVFGDNFYALSETTPSLGINLAVGNVVLSWSTNASGYQLQSVSALNSPIGWQDVTNAPAIVTTNYIVTNTVSNATGFYRLRK
jgi:hypothetical protein